MRVRKARRSDEVIVGYARHSAEQGQEVEVNWSGTEFYPGEGIPITATAAHSIRAGEPLTIVEDLEAEATPVSVELVVATNCPTCGVTLTAGIPIMVMDELRSNTVHVALQTLGAVLVAHGQHHREGGVG